MIAGVIFGAACCVGAWLLFDCDSEGGDDGEVLHCAVRQQRCVFCSRH
jgi:hypothetical protein